MFKNLTNFNYPRNVKEAIGFYLAYSTLIAIVGGLVGGGIEIVVYPNSFYILGIQVVKIVGKILSIITCLGLSFLVLRDKNLLDNFKFIFLGLLSGVLSIFSFGLLGGLIPVAYLTTRKVDKQ